MYSDSFTTLSPFGKIAIHLDHDVLCKLDYCPDASWSVSPTTDAALHVKQEIERYFENPKHLFDIPCQLIGTQLQKKIWQALRQIPPGKVASYGDIARELNTSARVVGNACRRNPIPLIIPCHRVVAKKSLGGFGGKTDGQMIKIKKWLLNHEGAIS